MAPWVQQGKVKYKETVVEGFEQLPKCLIGKLWENAGDVLGSGQTASLACRFCLVLFVVFSTS